MHLLSTNGVEPVMLRGLEKRANEHGPVPRRERPALRGKTIEGHEEYTDEDKEEEPSFDIPKHHLDDLA
ncbi:MAG TPA: hypothetical protein VKD23_10130 [Terriglobales bacterium]|nr:hypothetical protein [Terriglobales bacterium]